MLPLKITSYVTKTTHNTSPSNMKCSIKDKKHFQGAMYFLNTVTKQPTEFSYKKYD